MKKEQLFKLIFDYFKVTQEEIESSSREMRISQARHIFLIAYKKLNIKVPYWKLCDDLPWSSYGNLRHYNQQYIDNFPISQTADLFLNSFIHPNLKVITIDSNLFLFEPTDILTIDDFLKLQLK